MGNVVTSQQARTYVQIAHRLRIQRGPGKPDNVSERPREQKTGRYTDSDAPTLITFHRGDLADVESLLANGAIEEQPAVPSPVANKATNGG